MSGNDFRGDVVLQRRYEKLYGRKAEPEPAPRPVAEREIFELVKERYASLAPEELGERELARRTVQARKQIDAALAEQESAAHAAEKQSAVDVVKDTAIGQLWRNNHA